MPLQMSTTFRGISLPTAYFRVAGLTVFADEQRFVVHVKMYATVAAYSGGSGPLEDTKPYEFKNGAWTTFAQGLPNPGAANSGKHPVTLAQEALLTVPFFATATIV